MNFHKRLLSLINLSTMLASCLRLRSHQIRCCNENAAHPILFFNKTLCGPAAWVVFEFHEVVHVTPWTPAQRSEQ